MYRAYVPLVLIPLVVISFLLSHHYLHQPFFASPGENSRPAAAEKAPAPPPQKTPAEKQALEIFRRGYTAYHAQQYAAAINYFDQAIKKDPGCYQAYSFKGAALAFQGNYSQAIPWLDRAIKMNPHYEDAYFNKAISLELAGVYDQSLAYYDQAAAVNPRDPWTYYGKASIYGRLKNVSACVDNLKKAIALEPATKEHAKTEADFNNVRSAPAFQQLVYR